MSRVKTSKPPTYQETCGAWRSFKTTSWYLFYQGIYEEDVWTLKIQPQIESIIIHSLRSCNEQVDERPGSFEMFGYDFMVDDQLNVWIIEINKSPSLDSSTVLF